MTTFYPPQENSHPSPDLPWVCKRIPLRQGKFDLLKLHSLNPERYPHLLESTATGNAQARYSFAFAFPGEELQLNRDGKLYGITTDRVDFLSAFDDWWRREYHSLPNAVTPPNAPPFTGGWVLFLGYELTAQIEPVLRLPQAEGDWPIAWAIRIPAAVILDHATRELLLVAENTHQDLIDMMADDITRTDTVSPAFADFNVSCLQEPLAEDDPEPYLNAARHCIEYIHAGDVFQVNLSRAWRAALSPGWSHGDLYDRLRQRNPAPFAGLMTRGETAVISSSPERLVQSRNGIIQTRPIAGTRPRGSSGLVDIALSEELLAHPKERAEHIMLVDLERNDLSRVCRPGSVKVSEMMTIESYAHVHHIVSNICGYLTEDCAPGDVFRAVFPGGTITGCPKLRCMEILAEQEKTGRGAYTGSMGYVNRDGDCDLNILIRTIFRENQTALFRAGGGLVADSLPERELSETRAKARGMVRALEAGS